MRRHSEGMLGPVTGAYQWIMFPYRALAAIGDAFVRWLRDAWRDPVK